MKIKEGFLLRQVGDSFVVIPVGTHNVDFSNVITLNHSGAFIWGCLEKGMSRDEVVENLLGEYDVETAVAQQDVDQFIELLKTNHLLEQ